MLDNVLEEEERNSNRNSAASNVHADADDVVYSLVAVGAAAATTTAADARISFDEETKDDIQISAADDDRQCLSRNSDAHTKTASLLKKENSDLTSPKYADVDKSQKKAKSGNKSIRPVTVDVGSHDVEAATVIGNPAFV